MSIRVFEVLCNSVLLSIVHIFLMFMLTPRFSGKVTALLSLSNIVVAEGICELIPLTWIIRPLIVPMMVLLFVLLVYRDKWSTCVLLALCYGILESIAYALFYPGEQLQGVERLETFQQYLCWMPLLISTIVLLWLVFLGLRMVQARIGHREVLMYAAFPVSQFLMFIGWTRALQDSGNESSGIFLLVVLFLCLLADVIIFTFMFQGARRKELESMNRLLSSQIDAQRVHYAGLTAQYADVRRMRHDIAKHINAIEGLLAAGQSKEAAVYAAELKASAYDTTLGICEHPVVDAYIHRAIQEPLQDGIFVEVSLSVPADISISSIDLVCTFGNLMDNAAEACYGNPDGFIRLRACTEAGYLLISIENPVSRGGAKKAHIPGLERGIGFRVIEDMSRKYDGYFKHYVSGDIFRAEISYRLDV